MIHAAAQPSHDLAASRPFDDFDVNAVGTLNLLEAARRHTPEAVFITVSHQQGLRRQPQPACRSSSSTPAGTTPTRRCAEGIDETMSLDHCTHSLFGASKVAADVLTQEYGRYFGLRTGTFRGGCLTGPHHAGVELHGFLSYLVLTALREGPVHDLRLQGEAGPRPDPLGRRDQRASGPSPRTPGPARPTTSAAARPTPPACSSASSWSPTRPAASGPCSPTTSRPGSATTSATTPTWRKFRAHFPGWRQEHDLPAHRRGDGGRGGRAAR